MINNKFICPDHFVEKIEVFTGDVDEKTGEWVKTHICLKDIDDEHICHTKYGDFLYHSYLEKEIEPTFWEEICENTILGLFFKPTRIIKIEKCKRCGKIKTYKAFCQPFGNGYE